MVVSSARWRFTCALLGKAGGVEGIGDRGDQRAEIAVEAQHVGRLHLVAAAAQQRRHHDGEIDGADGLEALRDSRKVGEA